jgi:hypothetical protein
MDLVTSYPFRQPQRVFFNPFNPDEMWVTSFGNGMKSGNLSSTGMITFDSSHFEDIQVYPNPSKGNFTLVLNSDKLCEVLVKISNASGDQVLLKQVSLKPGQNSIPLNIHPAAPGIFALSVTTSGGIIRFKKLILQ